MKYLDFEQEITKIDLAISILQNDLETDDNQLQALEDQKLEELKNLYANLTAWQVTQVARHVNRPGFLDYAENMFTDFVEIHGDRLYGDDGAIITGWATLEDEKVMLIGQEKGHDVNTRLKRNFGMPNPEGYRKALRAAKLAEKFKKPIITFVDTPGAYPGLGAEERGQGEAIARNIMEFFGIKVPILSVIIGEGGSGGALGIAVADKVMILKHSIYSVISPESCASILWHDATRSQQAAEALKYTSQNLLKFGVVDEVVDEPIGGAHRNHSEMMKTLSKQLLADLDVLKIRNSAKLLSDRYNRFRKLGFYNEN